MTPYKNNLPANASPSEKRIAYAVAQIRAGKDFGEATASLTAYEINAVKQEVLNGR